MGGVWPQQVSGGTLEARQSMGTGRAQRRRPCSSDLKLALPLLPAGAWEKRGGVQLPTYKDTLFTANDCRSGGAPEGGGPRSLFVQPGLLSNKGGPASRRDF
jgi:hypothetical protein